MFTLIKNAVVYAPEFLGKKDVLIAWDRITAVEDHIDINLPFDFEVIEAGGRLLAPGFIDQHVHIIGGGGEGGFGTRIPEITSQDLLENGITTVVGLLGTDGVTRSMEALYAKAKALEEEGLSAFLYSGSYQVPTVTLTGSIQRDMVLIDKIIGVGEIAIADHRSFQPTLAELSRIAAEARVGGMLSGKAGVVHLHLGDDPRGLELILKVIEESFIPITHFIPTHVNRNGRLFQQALEFARSGGYIDLTAGFEEGKGPNSCLTAYEAVKKLYCEGIDESRIIMSSDGNGSKPSFDKNGVLTGIEAASCRVLFEDVRTAVLSLGLPLEKVLCTVTRNPARALKLRSKGVIAKGMDADLILMDSDLNIKIVMAKGKQIFKMKGV